jgi:predicted HTH transcriptional regulator
MDNQTYQIRSTLRTKLAEEDLVHVQRIALDFLKKHEWVTNRNLREITSVTYDQAIYFYGQMLKRRVLKKIGTGSVTHYVVGTKKRAKVTGVQ